VVVKNLAENKFIEQQEISNQVLNVCKSSQPSCISYLLGKVNLSKNVVYSRLYLVAEAFSSHRYVSYDYFILVEKCLLGSIHESLCKWYFCFCSSYQTYTPPIFSYPMLNYFP
jgi:hypothetical protein